MKKLILLTLTVLFSAFVWADNVLERDVPPEVRDCVYKNNSDAKGKTLEWTRNEKALRYEAKYYKDGMICGALVTTDGKFLKSYESLRLKEIPRFATDYVAKNYGSATIYAAEKVKKGDTSLYVVRLLVENNKSYSKKMYLTFDSKGNLTYIGA